MKITLLGTGSAEGWPGLFCRCEACCKARRLKGKNIRTRSSALIDGVLKIDFPPDILHQVVHNDLDLREMKALLFTHGHDDHFSPAELQYRGCYFVPEPISCPLPIFGPPDVIATLRNAIDQKLAPLSLQILQPFEMAVIAGYRVTPLLANHDPQRECFNYIVQDRSGATLLYASDTGWYEERTWQFLESYSLDGIVVECSKGVSEEGYPGHLCISQVIRLRERLIAAGCFAADRPMVTTHFSHLCGMMHKELEAVFSPFNIQPGYDGIMLDVPPVTDR